MRRWHKKERAKKVALRMKPPLSEAQKKCRIDFICDQVDETTGYYLDQANVIHPDESCFFLFVEQDGLNLPRG